VPVEAKPLFRPEVLRPRLAAFRPPEAGAPARAMLARWADLVATGRADAYTEKELLPDFLADVACGLLGYARAVDDPGRYTVSWEKHVQVDGKFADAVFGDFRPGAQRYVVAVEGKGPKDPLDRPFAGRKMSAVDQGYRYAINLPCDWIVVTSIRQTRLYHKGSDQYTYESFDTVALAADDALFKKFVFLLAAERVVPPAGPCHLDELATASEKVGKELTRDFYVRYANLREDAFEHLRAANPAVPARDVLAATQKVLDRVLFCAFCEDRGLLPAETITRAYQHADPYNPRPIWENFRGLFRAVDRGDARLNIPAYNGGLFADDPTLDALAVPDAVCRTFQDLAAYEYRPAHEAAPDAAAGPIDVDILGHIFEQSITDLERLRHELDGLREPQGREQHAARRKQEGAFYTPAFITRYILGQALGGALDDAFEALRRRHAAEAEGTAPRALADPRAYDLATLNAPQRAALVRFWEDWQDQGLATIRVLDPACGSGAFLIEAFEQLYQAYQRSNDRLEELRGDRTLFDLDRRILQDNLYGVDLNGEAVQVARLGLWIKTARRGKALTGLDHTLRVGNSLIADPQVDPRAFDWPAAFPEVFPRDGEVRSDRGGFDVVVGNPPYIRQEWIAPFKPYLKEHYQTYHGVADLYVYFYELAIRLLKPGGRLSFVVTNKWLKAGYGEPLRRFFAANAWVESLVDFGHAKQIFEDADVFPSIIVARKPTDGPAPTTTLVCAIPRELLRISDLDAQIEAGGIDVERARLGADAWSLEPKGVYELLAKIQENKPLVEFSGTKPFYGVKTGYNEAFLIDTPTKDSLVAQDARSAEIIRPYLRGQDIDRWLPEWAGLWMIFARRGVEIDAYPAIKRHLTAFREGLEPKPKDWQGRNWAGRKPGSYKWYEIQDPVEYWQEFLKPKLIYQVIQFYPSYCLDRAGYLGNDKTFFMPTDDLYLLGVLNSPLLWWHNWRYLTHLKDEALSPMGYMMEKLPIAQPSDETRSSVGLGVGRLIEITQALQETSRDVLDWLKVEHEVAEPSMRLRDPIALDSDALVAEVRKLRGRKKPLSLAALRGLREEHARTIVPAQALAAEARGLERQVSDLVNDAYGLTPADVRLMWETAPPRMPIGPP